MKNLKLIFAIFCLIFSIKTNAQPNPFFPMENGVWEEAFIGFAGFPIATYTVTCGDTLINDEVHAKLFELFLDTLGNINNRVYLGASKTGSDQVHYIPAGSLDPILLYDFSLETGQSIELVNFFFGTTSMNTLTVASNNLLTDNAGISRRVIVFENNFDINEVWIEGIGSNRGLLTRGLGPIADFEPFMNCFKYEDILLWSNQQTMPTCEFSFTELCGTTSTNNLQLEKIKLHIFPNPFQSETTIEIEGFKELEEPELRIYNIQGQLIQKSLELNEEKFSFFRKDLNAGLYVFELFDTKTTFALRKKIIITD